MVAIYVLFFVSWYALLHTYLVYPLLLWALDKLGVRRKQDVDSGASLPVVYVLMAVRNEEKVLESKIEALLASDYPTDKIHIFIGSDQSTDGTNALISAYAARYPNVEGIYFDSRQGKPSIINKLHKHVSGRFPIDDRQICIITDANVIPHKRCIYELASAFADRNIGVVDSAIINVGETNDGISVPESNYISIEGWIKEMEGRLWGALIGPFGGCFAVRFTDYQSVPPTHLVDDFYIVMKIIEKGKQAIHSRQAICYEPVTHELKVEYKRKRRISAGNFQNLATFSSMIWPLWKPVPFAFFSHKVLRWLSPVALVIFFLSSLTLSICTGYWFYELIFAFLGLCLIVLPALDFLLSKIGIHVKYLRSLRYYNFMLIAMFDGMIYYLKGVKSNVWEPTKRY